MVLPEADGGDGWWCMSIQMPGRELHGGLLLPNTRCPYMRSPDCSDWREAALSTRCYGAQWPWMLTFQGLKTGGCLASLPPKLGESRLLSRDRL